MKNKFANMLKHQIPLLLFTKDYNYILITRTIPLVMLGMKIIHYIDQLYGDKINIIIGFVYEP